MKEGGCVRLTLTVIVGSHLACGLRAVDVDLLLGLAGEIRDCHHVRGAGLALRTNRAVTVLLVGLKRCSSHCSNCGYLNL